MKLTPFLIVLTFTFLLTPSETQAALVASCEGASCGTCDVIALANSLVNWLIGILTVVFAIIVVAAGFQLATSGGNVEAKSNAKKKITNAIIGFIVVLAAWLLIDSLMKIMLVEEGGKIDNRPWSQIECVKQANTETAVDETGTLGMVGGSPTPSGDPTVAGDGVGQATAESDLEDYDVDIKTGATLTGVKPHVLEEVGFLNADFLANCPTCKNLTITEATGGTHASGDFSHANGFKLDLRTRDNPGLVDYVKTSFEPAGSWSDGTPLYYDQDSCGTYAIENDHIDVVYKTGCKP